MNDTRKLMGVLNEDRPSGTGLPQKPSLSIIIPAFNEERRLPPTFAKLENYFSTTVWRSIEVIVVNDGSQDRTAQVTCEFTKRKPEVRLVHNPGNRGKGYSVRHGVAHASGDWILFTDADLSTPLDELTKLLQVANNSAADVIIGSRALDRSLILKHQPFSRQLAGMLFNVAVRMTTGMSYRDTQCGFKLFSRRAARELFGRQQLDGFGFDVELLFIAQKLGLTVAEVPVVWEDAPGTKVSMLHGLDAFVDLLRVHVHAAQGNYRTSSLQETSCK